MVILRRVTYWCKKKEEASSLTEVLVATVLLLLIFGITITTLNRVLYSSVTRNTHSIETTLNELMYQYQSKKIKSPTSLNVKKWQVSIQKITDNGSHFIVFEATHRVSKKTISKKIIAYENE